jgi:hypothetical protein
MALARTLVGILHGVLQVVEHVGLARGVPMREAACALSGLCVAEHLPIKARSFAARRTNPPHGAGRGGHQGARE